MKKIIVLGYSLLLALPLTAQTEGGISSEMLQQFQKENLSTPASRAITNALATSDIKQLVKDPANQATYDTYFSNRVNTKGGITNQEKSGRCWLFTGLNVMRSKMIARYKLGDFHFSQCYTFFYDQLEKSNLFLQTVIDNAKKPMDDKLVEWLFKNPIGDGGQFTGVADLVTKYGVVPSNIMPETAASNETKAMSEILSLKLRQYGLELRAMAAKGSSKTAMAKTKTTMLSTIYRILSRCLGTPPKQFTWTRTDRDGKPVDTRTFTPQSFFKEYVAADLENNYVMLMNDPSRPFFRTYEIDMDRHTYDGHNWLYVNLPMDSIKQIAIRSIKDSTMVYFSCDVGKSLDTKRGYLDEDNYDYGSLFDTDFPMTKAGRIATFASASSHAMTLMAVDLDAAGKSKKWMVENSWGEGYGYKGYLIMTDKWFDEYMFRLVPEKKYVSSAILDILKTKPTKLPAWDPMFSQEQ